MACLIQVDLLEPVSHFLEAARENLSPENVIVLDSHKASNFYCVPLQVLCLDYFISITETSVNSLDFIVIDHH